MKLFNSFTKYEFITYTGLLILMGISGYIGYTDPVYFDEVFAREDNAIEDINFLLLLVISALLFIRFFKYKKNKPILWKLSILFFGFLFLFGAGEEISWGQRIFNLESSDFFLENNRQNEINFHNLEIGEVSLNRLIFSQLLTAVMAIYLLILPFLYRKNQRIHKLIDKLVIPIPQSNHIIAFIVLTIFIVILPNLSRKWEVFELFFTAMLLLIFLNPVNKSVYFVKPVSDSKSIK